MDRDILQVILKDTFTQTQLKHRMLLLKSYLVQNLFGGQQQGSSLTQTDLNWLNAKDQTFYQKFTKDNVYQLLGQLQDQSNQLLAVIIYLPFEADEGTISQIGSFGRKTFDNPDLLLDIKHDPTLIAGCALSWKGIYRDYSLRARIQENKQKILESFKKFLT